MHDVGAIEPTALSLEIIRSTDEFQALGDEWQDLYRRAGRTEVFLDHRWLQAWFTHLCRDAEPHVFAVRDRYGLIAAVPFVRRLERWRFQTVRTLEFPLGQESGNLRGDFLFRELPELPINMVVSWLRENPEEWDRIELFGFTAGSAGLRAFLGAASNVGLEVRDLRVNSELYYVPVEGTWPAYVASRGSKFRRNMRLAINRLNRENDVVIETTVGTAHIDQALADLELIDRISTKSAKEGLVAIENEVAGFYRQIASGFSPHGRCRIDLLKIDGRSVASLMSLSSEGCILLLHNSITPEARFYGGGRILFIRLFQEMFALRNAVRANISPEESVPEIDINGRTTFVRTFGQRSRAIVEGRIMNVTRSARIAQWRNTHLSPALQARHRRHRYIPLTPIFWRTRRKLNRHAAEKVFPPGDIGFYENGRTALSAGLAALPLSAGDRILFPNYHCGSEYAVLLEHGFELVHYPIERDLSIDIDKVEALCDGSIRAIYLIHHLGWPQPAARVRALADKWNIPLIEDCAQMLYCDAPGCNPGEYGDLAIYSLHKFLALADGGAAVLRPGQSARLPQGEALSIRDAATLFLKGHIQRLSHAPGLRATAGILLEHLVPLVLARLHFWRWGEEGKSMTRRSLKAFKRQDHVWVKQRRRANYARLAEGLAGLPGIELAYPRLDEGVVPLLFPFIADNPAPVEEALTNAGIEAGLHWSGVDPRFPLERFMETIFLKTHLMVVPVHQELDDGDIDIIIECIRGVYAAESTEPRQGTAPRESSETLNISTGDK